MYYTLQADSDIKVQYPKSESLDILEPAIRYRMFQKYLKVFNGFRYKTLNCLVICIFVFVVFLEKLMLSF